MSMLQTSEFLRNAPLVSETAQSASTWMFVFIYDHHYNWIEFIRQFPGSRVAGLGRLPNWTWHINELGKPNIRRAFMEHSNTHMSTHQYVLPSPASQLSIPRAPNLCTYGYVLQIPRIYDTLLHRHFSPSRIRMVQTISVVVNTHPPRFSKVNTIIYYDPRNTASNRHSVVGERSKRDEWNQGLIMLRNSGACWAYCQKIVRCLNGLVEDVEPLFICPAQVEGKGVSLGFREEERDRDVIFVEEEEEERVEVVVRRNPIVGAGVKRSGVNARKRARNPCVGEEGAITRPAKRQRRPSFGPAARPRRGTSAGASG